MIHQPPFATGERSGGLVSSSAFVFGLETGDLMPQAAVFGEPAQNGRPFGESKRKWH